MAVADERLRRVDYFMASIATAIVSNPKTMRSFINLELEIPTEDRLELFGSLVLQLAMKLQEKSETIVI